MTSARNSGVEKAIGKFPPRSSTSTKALLSRVARTSACDSVVQEDCGVPNGTDVSRFWSSDTRDSYGGDRETHRAAGSDCRQRPLRLHPGGAARAHRVHPAESTSTTLFYLQSSVRRRANSSLVATVTFLRIATIFLACSETECYMVAKRCVVMVSYPKAHRQVLYSQDSSFAATRVIDYHLNGRKEWNGSWVHGTSIK